MNICWPFTVPLIIYIFTWHFLHLILFYATVVNMTLCISKDIFSQFFWNSEENIYQVYFVCEEARLHRKKWIIIYIQGTFYAILYCWVYNRGESTHVQNCLEILNPLDFDKQFRVAPDLVLLYVETSPDLVLLYVEAFLEDFLEVQKFLLKKF